MFITRYSELSIKVRFRNVGVGAKGDLVALHLAAR
jgi:hypothetical protein